MEQHSVLSPRREGSATFAPSLSPASQTLVRGLDVLELVAAGPLALSALANRLGLARSTAHRLASALLERRYLTLVPRQGYGLGPKLLELGAQAQEQTGLVRIAQPFLERLVTETSETAYLCQEDAQTTLLIAWVPGRRRLLSSLRVGERTKLTRQAGGRALLLDSTEPLWRAAYERDCGNAASAADFLDSQRDFARIGYAFDPADSADNVRSIAAPVRGAGGAIVAAVGLSTAAHYLDEDRLAKLGQTLRAAAAELAYALGGRAPQACASPDEPETPSGTPAEEKSRVRPYTRC